MAQYLRLHARDCDFAATVLKACEFADAGESTLPEKNVRILKIPSQTADDDDTVYFQTQIEGMGDIMRKYFPLQPPVLIRSPLVNLLVAQDRTRLHRDPGHSHLPHLISGMFDGTTTCQSLITSHGKRQPKV